ncbi:TolC family outer membrane protein [Ehrlichia ruminantium]|nr:TolC family outer membrane protein [Ehrlichia ruminantium]QLK54542.1 TolC family outer membrane protein [Ehrlichia ruminantium]QLK57293.1 TolC family outer membrane protein [Ehrlichia ruminantium]
MYKTCYILILIMVLIMLPHGSYCTDLNQALHAALKNNPSIKAKFYGSLENRQRLKLNSISKFLPSIVYSYNSRFPGLTSDHNIKNMSISVTQQVFNGGADAAAFQQAKYLTNIEEINFLLEKQNVLLNAVKAYMKVLTTSEVYKLTQHTEKVLTEHLLATEKRFALAEVTKTDVSQATARLSAAKSESIKAYGNMKAAEASYVHTIGELPIDLQDPIAPVLPSSVEEALEIAQRNNLSLQISNNGHKAAKQGVLIALGHLLPSISVSAVTSYTETDIFNKDIQKTEDVFEIKMSLPIFQQGLNLGAVTQSELAVKQKMYAYYEALNSIKESIVSNWENISTANSVLQAAQDHVKYTEVVLFGVKKEVELNLRTILDVLDAEEELLKAKVNLVNVQSNVIISIYNLLALIGQLNIN